MNDLKIIGLNLFLSIFLMALLVMFFTGYFKDKTVKLEDVKFEYLQIDLELGESKDIKIIPVPEKAKISSIIWESEDEDIAQIDKQGKVTGISAGDTVINVIADNVIKSVKVYVN